MVRALRFVCLWFASAGLIRGPLLVGSPASQHPRQVRFVGQGPKAEAERPTRHAGSGRSARACTVQGTPGPTCPPSTWLGSSVLAVRVGDAALAEGLAQLCLDLESSDEGRVISNRGGGWQSKDLISHPSPALSEFSELLKEPLHAFLRGPDADHAHLEGDAGNTTIVIDQLWANVNRPGHWNERHNHGSLTRSLVASCVYFPAGGRGGSAASLRLFPDGEEEVQVIPQAGLLVMFPPDLEHQVDRVPVDGGARLSVACNVGVRWLDTPLLRAAHEGHQGKVQDLVGDAAKTEEADGVLGFRAIHLAAEAGHVEVMKTMLSLGTDAAPISFEGWSPLGLAADRGHVDFVEYLLERGIAQGHDEESRPGSEAEASRIGVSGVNGALQLAVERGHLPIVELLAHRNTLPLTLASAAGHVPIVRHLLSLRADPCKAPGTQKPQHAAARHGHSSVMRLLIDAGAAADATDDYGKCAAHVAADQGHSSVLRVLAEAAAPWEIDGVDKQGATPLHWAAGQGHSAAVAQLVAARASLDISAYGGAPGQPLYWAAKRGHVEVLESLLEFRADLRARADAGVKGSPEPLAPGTILVRKGGDVWDRVHFAEVLRKRQVRADAAGEAGGSPLHAAAASGQLSAAEALARWGAPASQRDDDGAAPQHWAAANGHTELVAHLLARGAKPAPADHAGGRPLHDAAWAGHEAVAEQLLLAGAPAGAADAGGLTALHAAAVLGNCRLLRLLLAHGAQGAAADAAGRRPVDLALTSLQLLRALGASTEYSRQMATRFEEAVAILSS